MLLKLTRHIVDQWGNPKEVGVLIVDTDEIMCVDNLDDGMMLMRLKSKPDDTFIIEADIDVYYNVLADEDGKAASLALAVTK